MLKGPGAAASTGQARQLGGMHGTLTARFNGQRPASTNALPRNARGCDLQATGTLQAGDGEEPQKDELSRQEIEFAPN